jgi:DNA-directed RNA polymerase specialized sigma24 family protein
MSKYSTLDNLLIASGDKSLSPTETQDAYTQFYNKVKEFVLSKVRDKIKDFHLTEDLSQDLHERLLRKAHQYKAQESLFPYLELIIKNMIINHWKRHGRRWDMPSLETFENWEEEVNQDGKFHRDDVFQ